MRTLRAYGEGVAEISVRLILMAGIECAALVSMKLLEVSRARATRTYQHLDVK